MFFQMKPTHFLQPQNTYLHEEAPSVGFFPFALLIVLSVVHLLLQQASYHLKNCAVDSDYIPLPSHLFSHKHPPEIGTSAYLSIHRGTSG
jgi:hypothetical protein